jgi:hypothetical protein
MLHRASCFQQDLPLGFDPKVGFCSPGTLMNEEEEEDELDFQAITELINSLS